MSDQTLATDEFHARLDRARERADAAVCCNRPVGACRCNVVPFGRRAPVVSLKRAAGPGVPPDLAA